MTIDYALLILVQGALLITSINCTIGPLNLMLLRQGIKGQHLALMVLTCVLCDLLLVGAGLLGLSHFFTSNRLLLLGATWGGMIVLLYYGGKALYAAWRGESALTQSAAATQQSLRKTLFAILALSFLNPGVYLQTVVMVGGVGSQYLPGERLLFGVGVGLASALWFVGLIYGAARLTSLFHRPLVGRALDLFSGGVMWLIALSLIW